MEVAQVSRGIVLTLKGAYPDDAVLPPIELIETIAFGHDIGHPPFGHGGEIALNYCMRGAGGFEANGQSIRILARMEPHTPHFGLDLSRRTLLGILKYPAAYSDIQQQGSAGATSVGRYVDPEVWTPPKCYLDTERDVVEWMLEPLSPSDRDTFLEYDAPTESQHGRTRHKTLDTSIMELADDISYGVHDFEDGIALKMIRRETWDKLREDLDVDWARRFGLGSFDDLGDALFGRTGTPRDDRKRAIGALVNALIGSVELRQSHLFEEPILDFEAVFLPEASRMLRALKNTTMDHVIYTQAVQTFAFRGRHILVSLFEAISSDPKNLLKWWFAEEFAHADSDQGQARILCDYIAGMTDDYAARMYERLFVPRSGSVFMKL